MVIVPRSRSLFPFKCWSLRLNFYVSSIHILYFSENIGPWCPKILPYVIFVLCWQQRPQSGLSMPISFINLAWALPRVSTEFRRHGIPCVFCASVSSVFRAKFRGITCRIIGQNFAELCDFFQKKYVHVLIMRQGWLWKRRLGCKILCIFKMIQNLTNRRLRPFLDECPYF